MLACRCRCLLLERRRGDPLAVPARTGHPDRGARRAVALGWDLAVTFQDSGVHWPRRPSTATGGDIGNRDDYAAAIEDFQPGTNASNDGSIGAHTLLETSVPVACSHTTSR